MANNYTNNLVISFLTLRKAVGFLGFLLPVVLVVGSMTVGDCDVIQSSISNYYHTSMRDVFVGFLAAISLFLFSYNGYDNRDAITSRLAAAFALCVALLPTSMTLPLLPCNLDYGNVSPLIGKLHLIFAASFFLTLAYFSIFLFTESDGELTQQKILRNRIYKISGGVMVLCMLLITAFFLYLSSRPEISALKPVFWLEVMALWAFSFSWLVKGGLLFADKTT